MYKYSHIIDDHTLGCSITPCLISAMLGSIKELNCLTLVRCIHSENYKPRSTIESIVDPKWINSFLNYHEGLVGELMEIDGITHAEASELIRKINCHLLSGQIRNDLGLLNPKRTPLAQKLIAAAKMAKLEGSKACGIGLQDLKVLWKFFQGFKS